MQDYVGKNIDRYRVISRQGMGGMAVVYHALDTRLDRDVAIKLIRTESIPQDQYEHLMKRFEREAKSQARFSHPNIVPVYDYGEVDGAPYLVMEYIPGGTLKDIVGKPIDYLKVTKWLRPIADALRYAHARNIIHRDVKPSNILINEEDRPMLTDFGIVKMIETDEMTLTGTGLGIGTPGYMAPEQWRGTALPQTDIYALGVVFYELLTGERPYTADTPAAVAIKQATEPLPRPAQFVPNLPDCVEEMLTKAMARNPKDRYENMTAFQQALDGLLNKNDNAVTETVIVGTEKLSNLETQIPMTPGLNSITLDSTLLKEKAQEVLSMPKKVRKESLPLKGEERRGFKKLPTWLVWGGAGIIILGLLIGLGSKLVDLGNEGTGPLAMLAKETSTLTLTHTAAFTRTATMTATAASTSTPIKTIIATIPPTATLGIGSTIIRENDGMEMVYVPAGEFTMGSEDGESNERPVHAVYLDAYWMDKYEVTNEQYAVFLNLAGGNLITDLIYWVDEGVWTIRITEQDGVWKANDGYENHPMVEVSWYGAQAYCEWAGGSLPTEAEWEKAARGTDERTYPWGNESPTCNLVNFDPGNGCVGDTSEVGSYPGGASPYGVLDMAGNVNEWMTDWYDENFYSDSPFENPMSSEDVSHYRILRGGSYLDYDLTLRASGRHPTYPSISWSHIGFRCVMESHP